MTPRAGFKRYTIYDAAHKAAKVDVDRWVSNVQRGSHECMQDDFENCHFAGIGGLEQRGAPEAPNYIALQDCEAFLHGYVAMAKKLYGDDWRTCEFAWQRALTIEQTGEQR